MMIIDTFFVISTSERSNICRNRSIYAPNDLVRGRTFVLIVDKDEMTHEPLFFFGYQLAMDNALYADI